MFASLQYHISMLVVFAALACLLLSELPQVRSSMVEKRDAIMHVMIIVTMHAVWFISLGYDVEIHQFVYLVDVFIPLGRVGGVHDDCLMLCGVERLFESDVR